MHLQWLIRPLHARAGPPHHLHDAATATPSYHCAQGLAGPPTSAIVPLLGDGHSGAGRLLGLVLLLETDGLID